MRKRKTHYLCELLQIYKEKKKVTIYSQSNFTMGNRRIIGIGETVLDVIFRNDQPTAAVPGGSAFNAIISLGRSVGTKYPNIPILMITETGDDHIGDIIVNFMRDNHVSTDAVTRNKDTKSHISMAFLDDKNDAQYEFYKDHAHASLNDEKFAGVEFSKEDIVLFGSFFAINPVLRKYTRRLISSAHEAGAFIYYDINFRKPHIKDLPDTIGNIIENFKFSSVVRGSTEDFSLLFGTSDPNEIYDKYLKDHCDLFICTDGGKPIIVHTPSFTAQYPVNPIETISTIGAGDNFNAGFLYGIIRNGLTKNMLAESDKSQWDNLIAFGQMFSSEVCQSIYNYIGLHSLDSYL